MSGEGEWGAAVKAEPASPVVSKSNLVWRLLRKADVLVFAPPRLRHELNKSKSGMGGIMTIMIPFVLAAYFAVIYVNNAGLPDVYQITQRNLEDYPPLKLSVRCSTHDSLGNANPFCPQNSGTIAPPIGFQFVPTLSGSACARYIARGDRKSNIPWVADYTSKAVYELQKDIGIDPAEIAGNTDQFQLTTFESLATDVSILPDEMWEHAGHTLAHFGGPPPSSYSYPTDTIESLANETLWDDPAMAEDPNLAHRTRRRIFAELDELNDLAVKAAAEAVAARNTTIVLKEIPLCPFPGVQYSASMVAAPPTSGVGYAITLPPYFNWSSYISSNQAEQARGQLVHYLMPDDAGLIQEPVPIVTTKGASTLGGSPFADELDVWQWYARTMSYSAKAFDHFPYVAYDIEILRTTFTNGSKPIIEVNSVASAGTMSVQDAVNYFGYGLNNDMLTLSSCGDVYALQSQDVKALYEIAVSSGYPLSFDVFVNGDDTAALADLLPSENVEFHGGCTSPGNAEGGWPAPACTAVQSFRSMIGDVPITFNITDPVMQDRLRAIQAHIRNLTWMVVHQNIITSYIGTEAVLNTSYGWQVMRANSNAIAAMMQLQHGCGLYCVEPVSAGVGRVSTVWSALPALQFETPQSAELNAQRLMLAYVQRRRSVLICDNATSRLPWTRYDEAEFFDGDFSDIRMFSGASGWFGSRLPAPMTIALFRTKAWTEKVVSPTKQSVLAIIGSTLGVSGTFFMGLLLAKRGYYLAAELAAEWRQKQKDDKEEKTNVQFENPLAARPGKHRLSMF